MPTETSIDNADADGSIRCSRSSTSLIFNLCFSRCKRTVSKTIKSQLHVTIHAQQPKCRNIILTNRVGPQGERVPSTKLKTTYESFGITKTLNFKRMRTHFNDGLPLPTHSSSHVDFSRLLRAAGCLELNDTRTHSGGFPRGEGIFYTFSIHIGFLLPFLLAGRTWAISSSSQLLWGGQYIMYSVHLRENAAGHWPPRAHPLL